MHNGNSPPPDSTQMLTEQPRVESCLVGYSLVFVILQMARRPPHIKDRILLFCLAYRLVCMKRCDELATWSLLTCVVAFQRRSMSDHLNRSARPQPTNRKLRNISPMNASGLINHATTQIVPLLSHRRPLPRPHVSPHPETPPVHQQNTALRPSARVTGEEV